MCVQVDFQRHLNLDGKLLVPAGELILDRYYKHLSTGTLARARRIDLGYTRMAQRVGRWTIELYPCEDVTQTIRREDQSNFVGRSSVIPGDLAADIELRMSELIREIAGRPTHQKLHIKDFTVMKEICKAAMLKHWSKPA